MTMITDRLNLYVCEHGCHNVTVDVDKGVTPFYMDCVRTASLNRPLDPSKSKDGVCTGGARSSFYPRKLPDGARMPIPTHEWYLPKSLKVPGGEVWLSGSDEIKLSPGEVEHVKNGGLLLRKRTDAKPVPHEV